MRFSAVVAQSLLLLGTQSVSASPIDRIQDDFDGEASVTVPAKAPTTSVPQIQPVIKPNPPSVPVPVKPGEPIRPVEPTKPIEPTKAPVVPVPVKPSQPTKPAPTVVKPAEPTKPAPTVVKPAEPTKPAPTVIKPAEPTKPAPTVIKPAEPTKPAPTVIKPAEPTKPAPTVIKPAEPTKPAPTVIKPAEPTKPAPTVIKPAEPTKPSETKIPISAIVPIVPTPQLNADLTEALRLHNAARATKNLKALTWNATLAVNAAGWAQYLAKNGLFEHSDASTRPNQGENLAWYKSSRTISNSSSIGTQEWLDEQKNYPNLPIPQGDFESYGHYTQVMWNTTTSVGIATVPDGQGAWYTVARYSPPGNIRGLKPY